MTEEYAAAERSVKTNISVSAADYPLRLNIPRIAIRSEIRGTAIW
jgi:hypothetical protein